MSKHTVTENIVQRGHEISGTLDCSCGLSASIEHRTKYARTSLTVARARLRKMHEAPKKESQPMPKAKKRQAKKTYEESEEIVSNLVEEPQDELEENSEDEGGAY